jgi:hypothetical protein
MALVRSACLGLLLGLHSAAVGSLITFGTAGIYVAFLLIALAALIARVRGTWKPPAAYASAHGRGDQRAGRGLVGLRDGEHRVAARVAGPRPMRRSTRSGRRRSRSR